ncbi:MAG: ECF transporter S component, partial [Clostridia bacterium]|nr:ECF transporter S component [Clostridia bacterium]
FIPFFKPVTAITMLSAIYLGSEAGFATGAFAALLSNFYFGQGPWTPFQMLAWGLIGLIAGILSKPLQKSRVLLLICGAVSGILFSMVMDVWNLLWTYNTLDLRLYGGVLLTALPHTVLYTVSNLVFLWLMAKPFGEKLNRIKIKYGV